jgi:PAS domain S-box-containing protein
MTGVLINERRSTGLVSRREVRFAIAALLISAAFFFVAVVFAKTPLVDLDSFIYGFLAANSLLIALLIEDNTYYARLARMERKYRGLFEAAPDALVVSNAAGEIVLLNAQAEKQFGYRRDELIGRKVTAVIPAGFTERPIADGLRFGEDAPPQRTGTGIERTARRKDATAFPIELMLSPLESSEGILVTAAIRDISARRKAEAKLQENIKELNHSNQDLAQFAAVASHELQEPLRMVTRYTQLLSSRYKGRLDADADEFIAFVVDGAQRMHTLIRDLLTYSRIGAKGTKLIEINSDEALRQAMINLRGAIEASGAQITHDPLPAVLADKMQLTRLFQNLVGNAIKYRKPGTPKIHISASMIGKKRWNFSVTDNGLGIDAQNFERIFGMFQRLHTRDEFPGTGIGLAICKKIVERHGGIISVDSQPGHGSTFRFALAEAADNLIVRESVIVAEQLLHLLSHLIRTTGYAGRPPSPASPATSACR